jgi:hypothetical protein
MNKENFISIDEIIDNYLNKEYDDKLNIIRKLSRDVTYNDDYQVKVVNKNLLIVIIKDLNNEIKSKSIESQLTYARLFFMFLHNELGNESSIQIKIFKQIFEDNFMILKEVYDNFKKDLKIQKFFLGIIYKLFLLNTKILNLYLSEEHYNLFIDIINNIDYNPKNPEERDNKEINDWINLIFEYILKNEEKCQKLNNQSLFNKMINYKDKNINIIILEIIRDIIDYAKDKKILLISTKHIPILCNLIEKTLNNINEIIKENDILRDYEKISLENINFINDNKIIICLTDIFSVILTTDDLNNEDYRKVSFENLNKESLYLKIIEILKQTDELYDKIFFRSKGLKSDQMKNIPILSQKNYFYGLQTNLMKFLSNFAYKNEHTKNFFIDKPEYFYYLLNHMKMDKCNPLKKEWTVLLIKCLCENCYKIQKLIMDLKPIEMDPLLKDYIINKGKQKVNFVNEGEKEINFSYLTKKENNNE